jgi:hypothetical protein
MVYFGDLVRRFAFGFAIFTSAFLLFQVQLLLGKFLLPWFGGTSGIWATCLLFFQVLLLAGYYYAHRISSTFRPAGQGQIHLAFLALTGLWILLAWDSDEGLLRHRGGESGERLLEYQTGSAH